MLTQCFVEKREACGVMFTQCCNTCASHFLLKKKKKVMLLILYMYLQKN